MCHISGKHPLHLGIFPQSRQHFITDIDFNRDQTSLISFIHAGHSHLKISGVGIRIPAGCNIEPCIKSRNNKNTHDNDHGNNVIMNLV